MTAIPSAAPRGTESGARALLDFYLARMRMAVQSDFQYRVATYFYMLGMVAEPVIYLVVWTTIAEQQGGSVNGLTPGYFAAYYITWTLVRNMNIVYGAPFWEYRIREGRLAGDLLKPIHPLHQDLAHFAGAKVVWILLWLPIAAALTLLFDPELDPRPLEIAVFAVAIWGAYLLRTMFQSTLGMLCFWTTRGAAIFDLWMMTELLLSGRLVPLPLMPEWVQELARFLPFQWAFFFPIETLVGDFSNEELLRGLGAQLLWILIGLVLFKVAWHHAIKRFSAVGN